MVTRVGLAESVRKRLYREVARSYLGRLELELQGDPRARAGLDVMAIRSLRALIRDLKAAGKCVLFSSHVMQEVAALCDEIVIIAEGKVAMHDSPDGIRNSTGCDDLEEAFVRAISSVGAY